MVGPLIHHLIKVARVSPPPFSFPFTQFDKNRQRGATRGSKVGKAWTRFEGDGRGARAVGMRAVGGRARVYVYVFSLNDT